MVQKKKSSGPGKQGRKPTKKAAAGKTSAGKSAAGKNGAGKTAAGSNAKPRDLAAAAKAAEALNWRVLERRKHPRFLLSREQFREIRSGRIFSVYDLSASGLSVKIDEHYWQPGAIISGILNLHPESIELSPRLVGYHGDRAALKLEGVSTYAKSVLERALSPRRLGASLALVREKLPIVDYWFHGLCNTDLLLRLNPHGEISKVELFFSNYYWNWSEATARRATGLCQSVGKQEREGMILSEAPVELENIDINLDSKEDPQKTRWAKGIVEAAPLEPRLKDALLKKFDQPIE